MTPSCHGPLRALPTVTTQPRPLCYQPALATYFLRFPASCPSMPGTPNPVLTALTGGHPHRPRDSNPAWSCLEIIESCLSTWKPPGAPPPPLGSPPSSMSSPEPEAQGCHVTSSASSSPTSNPQLLHPLAHLEPGHCPSQGQSSFPGLRRAPVRPLHNCQRPHLILRCDSHPPPQLVPRPSVAPISPSG